jgi:hypothetical protein
MGTRKRRAEIAKSESESEIAISEYDLTMAPVPANPTEHLLQIPGSERALISLTGKGFERNLLSRLDWFTYMYVTLLVLFFLEIIIMIILPLNGYRLFSVLSFN